MVVYNNTWILLSRMIEIQIPSGPASKQFSTWHWLSITGLSKPITTIFKYFHCDLITAETLHNHSIILYKKYNPHLCMIHSNISSVSQRPTNLSITVYHSHLSAHSSEFSGRGLHIMSGSCGPMCEKSIDPSYQWLTTHKYKSVAIMIQFNQILNHKFITK